MKRVVFCASLLAVFLLAGDPRPSRIYAQPPNAPLEKQVLILHAHEANAPVFEETDRALARTLRAGGVPALNQLFESLDLRRNPDPAYRKALLEEMRAKYAHRKPDLIVTMFPEALDFLLNEGRTLFPDTPILALYMPAGGTPLQTSRRIISHFPELDINGTLEIALRLAPDTKRVFVISGTHAVDRRVEALARREFKKWGERLEFRYLSGTPLDEIQQTLAAAPSDSVALLLVYTSDAAGVNYFVSDVAQRLSQASRVPVFGLLESALGHGIVGGSLLSFERVGERAGQLALDILRGGRVSEDVAPVLNVPAAPMFDWRQLTRWKLNPDAVPPGSVIINRQFTLWEQYRTELIWACAALIIQALVIMALLIQRRERQVAEEALRDNEQRLRLAMNAAALGAWSWDIRKDKVRAPWITGEPSVELSLTEALERVHPEDRERVKRVVRDAIASGKEYKTEYRLILPDRTVRWVESRGGCMYDQTGNPLRLNGVSLDVTERKRADLSLQESERRFRTMADAAPVMVWMSGRNKECVYFNRRWLDFTGRPLEDEMGAGWTQGVHSDDLERCLQTYSQAFDAREQFEIEYRLRRFDGEYRWILDLGTPLYEDDGSFVGYIGSCYDITERKRAEEQRQLMAVVVESSPDAIVSLTPDGKYTSWNRQAEALFGYTAEEALGKDIALIVPPELRDEPLRAIEQIKAGQSIAIESVRLAKDGRRIAVLVTSAPIRGAGGEVEGVSTIIHDITQRKETERALAESEAELLALFDSTEDLVWCVDPDRFGLLKFNRALSDYFLRDVGITIRVGMTPEEMLPPEYAAQWHELYRRALRDSGFVIEYDVFAKTRVLLLSFNLLRRQGEVFGISVFAKDITDRKRGELELKASEQRFRTLIEESPVAIGVGREGLILYTNKRYLEMFGYTAADDLSGRAIVDQWTPESREELLNRRERFRLGLPIPPEYEGMALRKDGSAFPVHAFYGRVQLADGEASIAFLTDITDRRRAEAALRESEERFRQVAETVGDFIWEVDATGLYRYTSPSVEKILGYAPDELIGKVHFYDLFVPEMREELTAAAFRVFATKEPFRAFPNPNLRKDGKVIHLETSGVPILDAGGALMGYRGADTDVTAPKWVEEQTLRHAAHMVFLSQTAMGFVQLPVESDIHLFIAENLRQLVPDGICVAVSSFDDETREMKVETLLADGEDLQNIVAVLRRDPKGMSFALNKEAWDGLVSGSLVRVPGGVYELLLGTVPEATCKALEERAGIGDILAMGFSRGGQLYGSATIIMRKGSELQNREVIETFVHQAGVALHRERIGERLRASQALSRGILASIPGNMAILDRPGMIIHVNETWSEFAAANGLQDVHAVGVGADYLAPCRRAAEEGDASAQVALDGILAVLAGRTSEFRLEYPCHSPTQERWFSMAVLSLQRPEGGAVIYHQDITGRRHAELETDRLRRELAHMSRVTLMGELTGSLAHELNQPLTAIATNAHAGQRYLAQPSPPLEELREILVDVAADAVRAGEVIHRMRSLLKKDVSRFRVLDLNEVIREVEALTRTDAIIRHQPLELALAADLPAVLGDRVQLQQVLLNLVMNGMEAMQAQGPAARHLRIETRREAACVRVGVQDAGPGIPADKLGQVFDAFFTTKPTGMGMGLAITRSIVEAHGGRIWAENNPDRGATFWFTLPLPRPLPPGAPA